MGIESSSFRNGRRTSRCSRWTSSPAPASCCTVTPDGPHADAVPRHAQLLRHPRLRAAAAHRARAGVARTSTCGTSPCTSVDAGRRADVEVCADRVHDGEPVDFVDGTWFAPDEVRVTLGSWAQDGAAHLSDYTGTQIYYRSVQTRERGLAERPRLPLALGHRLVLVLARVRRAAPRSCAGCGRSAGCAATSTGSSSPSSGGTAGRRGWDLRRGLPPREDVVQDVEVPVERLRRLHGRLRPRGAGRAGLVLPAAAALARAALAAVPADARAGCTSTSASGRASPLEHRARPADAHNRARRAAGRATSAATSRSTARPATPARSSTGCTAEQAYAAAEGGVRPVRPAAGPLRQVRAQQVRRRTR